MGINMVREKYIRIGFIKRTQITYFCKCGYKVAQKIYDDIKAQTEAQGKIVNESLGIRTTRLIKALDLKESDILRMAEEERQKEKDA